MAGRVLYLLFKPTNEKFSSELSSTQKSRRFQYMAHASTPHGNEIRLPQIRKNHHNNWRPGSWKSHSIQMSPWVFGRAPCYITRSFPTRVGKRCVCTAVLTMHNAPEYYKGEFLSPRISMQWENRINYRNKSKSYQATDNIKNPPQTQGIF